MKKIICLLLMTTVCYNCFSQDILRNSLKSRDSLQLYKLSIWRGYLFKIGDTVYTVRRLKPLMQNNRQADVSFKSFRVNNTIAGGFAFFSGASFYRVAEGLIQKNNIFPFVCSTVGTYFLAQVFHKKSIQQITKAMTIYNLGLHW